MKVLITGGMGYIGAHICTDLLLRGHRVAVTVEPTSKIWRVTNQVELLTGLRPWVFRCDIRQEVVLTHALQTFKPDIVINCACQKAPTGGNNESLFDVNVGGLQSLLRAMSLTGTKHLIHLSSAMVKGPIETMSAYGQSKMVAEQVLQRQIENDPTFHALCLRVHNVSGNHPSGFLAEDELSAVNLFVMMAQAASREKSPISLFPIIRDYTHVMDVARAMHPAINYTLEHRDPRVIDIGTGVGSSPIDVLRAFEQHTGRSIIHHLQPIPADMVVRCVADTTNAQRAFGWTAKSCLKELCRDTWFTYTTGNNRTTPAPFSRIASCRSL